MRNTGTDDAGVNDHRRAASRPRAGRRLPATPFTATTFAAVAASAVAASAVAASAVAAAMIAFTVGATGGIGAVHAGYARAAVEFADERAEALREVSAARAAIDAAQTMLEDSAGKMPRALSRVSMAAAVDAASLRVDSAAAEVREFARPSAVRAPVTPTDVLFPVAALRGATGDLANHRFRAAEELPLIIDELDATSRILADAVLAWQAEQDRIVRERYTNFVHAAGWIPELDQCRGSVDLSARYGTAAIAEHWSCGGKDFPDEPGTIITLTGVRSGTYRVDGIVKMLDQKTATTADIPTGYDLLYQTCQDGWSWSMSLTALTKIG